MKIITSAAGLEEKVTVRRSESADAQGIDGLVGPSARAVFGRVNVIHLLEKANLAVTLADEKDAVVAHASFFDHPVGGLVDQTRWESFLQEHFSAEKCTPLNSLFLHLFVAQPQFATASVKEIVRAVFSAVPQLEHLCLLSPHVAALEPALDGVFEPLQRLSDPGPRCLALVCRRPQLCPQLHIRPARVEDHDDVMRIFAEQTNVLSAVEQPFFLTELIESQDEENHAAICESDGVAVGFMSFSRDVDLKRLQDNFELTEFNGFKKQDGAQGEAQQEERRWAGHKPNAVSIQLFVIDRSYEARSVDFIPFIFKRVPDVDFCIITMPTLSPDFPLLHSFLRVTPRAAAQPPCELYMFHRDGLRSVEVRPAVAADRPAVCDLVEGRSLSQTLLQDLDCFYETCRDQDGVTLQAFVVQQDGQVVGIVMIRDEQDIKYLCSHYNMENFIYLSHHSLEEHAQLRHLVLRSSLTLFTQHVFKEVLRLARRSCLFLRTHPSVQQQTSCIPRLDAVLDCAVPVRPRRQIVFPLEELGINAPSRQVTEEQPPFALSLISRKLTLEPKVTVNARIVVVGASDTGLSVLEVFCFCPHLRFNNLTLVSTHGLPGNGDQEDGGFLSTSHAYSSSDLALLPLRSCVTVVTGKMVAINRKCKHIAVSGGRKVSYDHLILCTGLQYQEPRPPAEDLKDGSSFSNLFTLNDLYDCAAARRWVCRSFVEQEEHAIIYGNGIDVFTAAEALLSLGVQGHRIHLVLPPPDPGAVCFSDPNVEKAVASALEKAAVRVHRDCLLVQVNQGGRPDVLTHVSFSTNTETVHLQCGLFINVSNKGVDHDAFRSINDSFLVFDSRLVIDATFHTSDPHISAAGPLTKYSGRYYADEWSHANFNSKEVGGALAATLMPLFDPTLEPLDAQPESGLVPLYKDAKIQGGKLPGGYNYLHVTKPSPSVPTAPPAGQDSGIVTGRAETGNYFCLRLDQLELVETLTCLSLKPLPFSNYLSLYRKHQRLLGQLCSRYQQGLIPDLYSFLRQSWCLAVYHDRFSDLEQELSSLSLLDGETEDASLVPQGGFGDAGRRAALRSAAVKYLTYNRNLLPMFAAPGQL